MLASLYRIQRNNTCRTPANAKCAPHYIKTVLENLSAKRSGPGGMPPRFGLPAGTPAEAGLSAIRTYSGGAGGCPAGTHYMGIRPNGDVTPCPYLPVFAGTLRTTSLWRAPRTSSELFVGIRRRTSLGGRCGECEMNGHCGGCRARAYGMTGDLMAEDPLCTHTPGTFAGSPLSAMAPGSGPGGGRGGLGRGVGGGGGGGPAGPKPRSAIHTAANHQPTIAWDDDAAARMKRSPPLSVGWW